MNDPISEDDVLVQARPTGYSQRLVFFQPVITVARQDVLAGAHGIQAGDINCGNCVHGHRHQRQWDPDHHCGLPCGEWVNAEGSEKI